MSLNDTKYDILEIYTSKGKVSKDMTSLEYIPLKAKFPRIWHPWNICLLK